MPALPSVPKVLKVQYGFRIGEDLGALCHEFWAYTGTGPSDADLSTFTATIAGSFNTNICPLMTTDRSLTSVKATDLTTPTSAVYENVVTYDGTGADVDFQASSAVCLSREIARRYRGGHPRTYLPIGQPSVMQDAQTWTSDFVSAALAAWLEHVLTVETGPPATLGTVSPVNVSYYQGFTPHEGTTGRYRNISNPRLTPIVDAVTSFIVREGIAQIRRRLLHLA